MPESPQTHGHSGLVSMPRVCDRRSLRRAGGTGPSHSRPPGRGKVGPLLTDSVVDPGTAALRKRPTVRGGPSRSRMGETTAQQAGEFAFEHRFSFLRQLKAARVRRVHHEAAPSRELQRTRG